MRWQAILLVLSIGGEAVAIIGWSGALSDRSSRLSTQAQMAIGNTPISHLLWGMLGGLSLMGILVAGAAWYVFLHTPVERSSHPAGRIRRKSTRHYRSIDLL